MAAGGDVEAGIAATPSLPVEAVYTVYTQPSAVCQQYIHNIIINKLDLQLAVGLPPPEQRVQLYSNTAVQPY